MQLNELRLGNWVNARFMTDNFNFKIAGFHKNALVYKKDVSYDISTLYPITLSEYWLIQAGFTLTRAEAFKVFNNEGNIFLINKIGYNWEFSWGSVPIWHVHQLQNLYFALTGTELEF